MLPNIPTLSDIGITKMQAGRWQRISKLPEDRFKSFIAGINERNDSSPIMPEGERGRIEGRFPFTK